VTDPSNFIALDTSNVTDLAGNAGSTVAVSNNYALDGERPDRDGGCCQPEPGCRPDLPGDHHLQRSGQRLRLADLSVANGTLSNLSSSDGGKTWTATSRRPPTSTRQQCISIDTAGVSDSRATAAADQSVQQLRDQYGAGGRTA
jgi:hypothetical protein